MSVLQISVFIENRKGRLAEMTRLLGERGVNLRALYVADTADYGIARMIVDSPEDAAKILKDDGYTVNTTDVVALEIPDEPGGIARVLTLLDDNNLNIEYLYGFADREGRSAIDIMRIEETDRAREVLMANGIKVIDGSEVYSL